MPLDRYGYLENCYFTLSYSPIRDESGGVGGMLAVVAETTERVQGERRLKTLASGYQIHVPKPVEPAELITVIASLVERPTTPWRAST
ncbi:MAG TPA: hypothetical protein VFO63_08230 [Blastocatellia bacterium]|nr:hypothetical protein [Blastocatellia bacterium]